MITDLQVQHELLKTALEATDNYLFLDKRARDAGIATNRTLHDFTYEMARAHDALQALGVLDQHQDYMEEHTQAILKLHGHHDQSVADIPYVHVPAADVGEVEESVQDKLYTRHQNLRKASGLPHPDYYKELKTTFDLPHDERMQKTSELKKKYNVREETPVWDKPSPVKKSTPLTPEQKSKAKSRAKSAGRPYPNMVDNIWAARQESKVLSFGQFIIEEKKNSEESLSEEEIDQIVDELTWEDIVDLYDDIELEYEEDSEEPEEESEEELEESLLDEKLSVQSRLKKRQAFARMRGKRNTARNMKLRRASSMDVLKKRAVVAARRAVYKRFLRGRDKASLSAAEKDRIEQQVSRMKYMQTAIATKMLPKMRSIEQKRLSGYRTRKSSAPGGTKTSKAPGGTKAQKSRKK
jgi:hypothetical protein